MISSTQLTLLHLNLIKGIGAATIAHILEKKPHTMLLQEIYSCSASDVRHFFGLTATQSQIIAAGLSDVGILEQELALLMRYSIGLLTVLDEPYPAPLKEIYAPPAIIYYQGDLLVLQGQMLSLVGSRRVNAYGVQVVEQLVPDLVAAGFALVSGGAIGADSAVHQQTLRHKGGTVAVLGSGLLRLYPRTNKKLFDEIASQGGALVSPFALHDAAMPGNFPARNRIIAGLSRGCVVVQAARQSGALITAQYALEQGRDVFAVPGLITDPLSAGCHDLVQQGAILVQSSADILREYGIAQKSAHRHESSCLLETREIVPAEQQALLDLCMMPRSLDDLFSATGIDYTHLTAHLFELQTTGKIQQDFMGMWQTQSR